MRVYCLGAMNTDRKLKVKEKALMGTSNPAFAEITAGGVGRNIADNIARLGIPITLLSGSGGDGDFEFLKQQASPNLDMSHVDVIEAYNTGSYTAVLDIDGRMIIALADMDIYDRLDCGWLETHRKELSAADKIIVDLNLPMETVRAALALAAKHQIETWVVSVSGPKMRHLPDNLEAVTWLIVNQDESEFFFDYPATDEKRFADLGDKWLETGVKNVIITRGAKPALYASAELGLGNPQFYLPPPVDIVDVTGAGDSYASAVFYGIYKGMPVSKAIQMGMTNAFLTLGSSLTVRPELCAEELELQWKKLFSEGETDETY